MNELGDNLYAKSNVGSIDEAFEIMYTLWNKVNPDIVFSEENPLGNEPDKTVLPHITYDIALRTHADKLSDGRKPRTMSVKPDPEQEGHNLIEVAEWFDCLVEFCIYGETKREARETADKLEQFMLTYTGYFKKQGISEILFKEEGKPEVSSEYRQDIPHRLLRYSVRIQRSQTLRSIRLSDVDVVAKIAFPEEGSKEVEIYPSKSQEFLNLYHNQIR